MQGMSRRPEHIPTVFAPDNRSGADQYVYCKGCGRSLDGEPRRHGYRVPVSTMMCDACCSMHKHQLIPASGAPSFCYRCGRPDEIFVEHGHQPATYHVCPHCRPEQAARFRSGNFQLQPGAGVAPGATVSQ